MIVIAFKKAYELNNHYSNIEIKLVLRTEQAGKIIIIMYYN